MISTARSTPMVVRVGVRLINLSWSKRSSRFRRPPRPRGIQPVLLRSITLLISLPDGDAMNSKSKKPTGTIGELRMAKAGGHFEAVEWPRTKAAIETAVLDGALTSARAKGMDLFDLVRPPIQNPEDDFDFTLYTRAGEQYLDLMEVAPLRAVGGSHSKAPRAYVVGELADRVWEEISRKSTGYGSAPRTTIHLLLYPTDWRFLIGREVIDLLSFWSVGREHCFTSIVFYASSNATSGDLARIYPRKVDDFSTFVESEARDRVVLNADLSAFQNGPGGSVEVPLIPLEKSSGHRTLESPSPPNPDNSSVSGTGIIGSVALSVPLSAYIKKQRKS